MIILSARSRRAQEKWDSEEASSSTSRAKWAPINESQVVRIRTQRQDLASRETVLTAPEQSSRERAQPPPGELQAWFDVATETRNRAPLRLCGAPGPSFVRFSDQRDFVLFSMSNFRSELADLLGTSAAPVRNSFWREIKRIRWNAGLGSVA